MDNIKAVILAAGKGTRLRSDDMLMPKHMREVAGKPILHYVLKSVDAIDKKDIILVVGHMKEAIMEKFPERNFVIQDVVNNPLGYGTGAAVRYAEQAIGDFSGDVMVLMGDAPLVTEETLINLFIEHKKNNNDCTNLSYEINDNLTLGRIVRDENGNFREIIENRDATEEQKKITEYNSGNAIFNSKKLFEQLVNLKNNNNSEEYYLTDIPKIFMEKKYKVGVYKSANSTEIHAVNTQEDLDQIENILTLNSTK